MKYKHKETDVPTILPDDAWAISANADGLELYIPQMEEDADVPDNAAFLVAVLVRSDDPVWRDELMDWFAKNSDWVRNDPCVPSEH